MISQKISLLFSVSVILLTYGAFGQSVGTAEIEIISQPSSQTSPSCQFVIPAIIKPSDSSASVSNLPLIPNYGNSLQNCPGILQPIVIDGGKSDSNSNSDMLLFLLLLSLKNKKFGGACSGFGGNNGAFGGPCNGCGNCNYGGGCSGFGGPGSCSGGCGNYGGCRGYGGCGNCGYGGPGCGCGGFFDSYGNSIDYPYQPYPYPIYSDDTTTVLYV